MSGPKRSRVRLSPEAKKQQREERKRQEAERRKQLEQEKLARLVSTVGECERQLLNSIAEVSAIQKVILESRFKDLSAEKACLESQKQFDLARDELKTAAERNASEPNSSNLHATQKTFNFRKRKLEKSKRLIQKIANNAKDAEEEYLNVFEQYGLLEQKVNGGIQRLGDYLDGSVVKTVTSEIQESLGQLEECSDSQLLRDFKVRLSSLSNRWDAAALNGKNLRQTKDDIESNVERLKKKITSFEESELRQFVDGSLTTKLSKSVEAIVLTPASNDKVYLETLNLVKRMSDEFQSLNQMAQVARLRQDIKIGMDRLSEIESKVNSNLERCKRFAAEHLNDIQRNIGSIRHMFNVKESESGKKELENLMGELMAMLKTVDDAESEWMRSRQLALDSVNNVEMRFSLLRERTAIASSVPRRIGEISAQIAAIRQQFELEQFAEVADGCDCVNSFLDEAWEVGARGEMANALLNKLEFEFNGLIEEFPADIDGKLSSTTSDLVCSARQAIATENERQTEALIKKTRLTLNALSVNAAERREERLEQEALGAASLERLIEIQSALVGDSVFQKWRPDERRTLLKKIGIARRSYSTGAVEIVSKISCDIEADFESLSKTVAELERSDNRPFVKEKLTSVLAQMGFEISETDSPEDFESFAFIASSSEIGKLDVNLDLTGSITITPEDEQIINNTSLNGLKTKSCPSVLPVIDELRKRIAVDGISISPPVWPGMPQVDEQELEMDDFSFEDREIEKEPETDE